MREREIWLYLVLLLFQIIWGFLELFGMTDKQDDPQHKESALQHLGHMISLTSCCVMGVVIGRSAYTFRQSGGLHGGLRKGENAVPINGEDDDQFRAL